MVGWAGGEGYPKRNSPNEFQVGGDHYKSEFQHWDLIEDAGLGYLEGCATKYIARWRKKAGVQDLEKAMHYVDKLIEKHYSRNRLPRGIASDELLSKFFGANQIPIEEAGLISMLCRWEGVGDLKKVKSSLEQLIRRNVETS